MKGAGKSDRPPLYCMIDILGERSLEEGEEIEGGDGGSEGR